MDLPIENGGSFHSYVSLPEGITMRCKAPFFSRSKGFYSAQIDVVWRCAKPINPNVVKLR